MSCVIKDGNIYKVYIKGADNVIKRRLKPGEQPYLEYIDGKLMEFSRIGLRTLMMAMKVLSEQEWEHF